MKLGTATCDVSGDVDVGVDVPVIVDVNVNVTPAADVIASDHTILLSIATMRSSSSNPRPWRPASMISRVFITSSVHADSIASPLAIA